MKIHIAMARLIVLALLTGASGCGKKEAAAVPPPLHVLSGRGFAAPLAGQIIVSFTGTVSTKSKGKIVLQDRDVFPFIGVSRNPFIQNLEYPPGMILSVTLTVTAPNTQTVVGCEIIDRGVSVVRKNKAVKVDSDKGTFVVCGPYTTAAG